MQWLDFAASINAGLQPLGFLVSVPSAKAVLGLKISCTAFAIFHNGLASLATFALGIKNEEKL